MPGYDDVIILVNGVDACGELADRALALHEIAHETLSDVPVNRLSHTEDRRRLIRTTHLLAASADTVRALWAAIAELGGRLRAAREREHAKEERLEPGGSEAETQGGRRRRPSRVAPVEVGVDRVAESVGAAAELGGAAPLVDDAASAKAAAP